VAILRGAQMTMHGKIESTSVRDWLLSPTSTSGALMGGTIGAYTGGPFGALAGVLIGSATGAAYGLAIEHFGPRPSSSDERSESAAANGATRE